MNKAELSSYDIAILSCLRNWGSKSITEQLRALISFMDYYDHSIITFEEFRQSAGKLINCGIISSKEKGFYTHETYIKWHSKKYATKTVGLEKELKETKEFISKNFTSLKASSSTDKFPISKDEFDAAVNLYLNKE